MRGDDVTHKKRERERRKEVRRIKEESLLLSWSLYFHPLPPETGLSGRATPRSAQRASSRLGLAWFVSFAYLPFFRFFLPHSPLVNNTWRSGCVCAFARAHSYGQRTVRISEQGRDEKEEEREMLRATLFVCVLSRIVFLFFFFFGFIYCCSCIRQGDASSAAFKTYRALWRRLASVQVQQWRGKKTRPRLATTLANFTPAFLYSFFFFLFFSFVLLLVLLLLLLSPLLLAVLLLGWLAVVRRKSLLRCSWLLLFPFFTSSKNCFFFF